MANEKYSSSKIQRAKDYAKNTILGLTAGALTYVSTGCASMNIRPTLSASSNEAGGLEAKAGIAFTGESCDNPQFHGGFWNEAGQTVFGPFHVYRAKDGKFFPEFREHPYRTTGMTVLYVGAAAALAGGHGGGSSSGSSSTTPAPTAPSQPSHPSNGGSSSGSSSGGSSTPAPTPTPTPTPSPGGQGDGGI